MNKGKGVGEGKRAVMVGKSREKRSQCQKKTT